jgi:hypothetical protein
VIGLGSSKPVDEIAKNGEEPITAVLRALRRPRRQARSIPGRAIRATMPLSAASQACRPAQTSCSSRTEDRQVGKEAGLAAQFRDTQKNYQRKKLDLVQIFSLTDLDVHWPTLKELKAAGEARSKHRVTVAETRSTSSSRVS